MGQDIDKRHFSDADFAAFEERLKAETETLERWFTDGRFAEAPPVGGFELEAWLTDDAFRPAPLNDILLERSSDLMLTSELARFNIELNTRPEPLSGPALTRMHRQLRTTWQACSEVAADIGARLLAIGILPTVGQADLTAAAMTPSARFAALSDQVKRQREGRPLLIDIAGETRLRTSHPDLMLESAATSFQVHMQVPASRAGDYYNAAMLVSAAVVAASANSPYLFGKDLWAETRIPLFEQAVEVGGIAGASQGPPRRVGFGTGYVRRSLAEVFRENLEHFPVMLPMLAPQEDWGELPHLQLQNGTLWRWNRPLIGFDDAGEPHVRIEHRVVPGGPSTGDAIANAALFFGLVSFYAGRQDQPCNQLLAFPDARDNFYQAARHGLSARLRWTDGAHHPVDRLLSEQLLPCARQGLRDLGIDSSDIDDYLGLVAARVENGQNGATWQRAWVARHGDDMRSLTAAYAQRQGDDAPVHCWTV